jgi:putative ABC transport system ATP-binding protein
MIIIDHLTKIYAEGSESSVRAVDAVSLVIERGEQVALIGSSGSGKSTLLNLIGGIDGASGGSITIDGREITGLDDRKLTLLRREMIGIVFQFFNLMPTLTVIENVMLPAELAGRSERESRARALALLEEVGMAPRAAHRPHELSGGEMQRTAIARALINRPPILLADEPTGNLDSRSGALVLELLRRLARDEGLTLVMATHDMAIAKQADRVVEMRDGRLVGEDL